MSIVLEPFIKEVFQCFDVALYDSVGKTAFDGVGATVTAAFIFGS